MAGKQTGCQNVFGRIIQNKRYISGLLYFLILLPHYMDPNPKSAPRKTPLLPRGDRQLAALGVTVGKYWLTQPWLTLRYVTAAEFQLKAPGYEAAVNSRELAGSTRPIEADELLTLDHTIETTIYRVKNRLIDKYDKKTAPAHYPTVGISKNGRNYELAADRPTRAAALNTLLAGLLTEKIGDGDYGTAFWTPIAQRYNKLVGQLTNTDGAISKAVAAKDTQRAFVSTVLSSLAKALDANFPDEAEYKAELRAAGFQR